MEGWTQSLAAVTASGNLEQLYPSWAPAGVDPASATTGQQLRGPVEGKVWSLQLQTDGTNAGIIELWDVNGADAGANVSSTNVITNAQLVALQALGKAKLMYSQNFIASPETPITMGVKAFQHGLAARFVGLAGTLGVNLTVSGGFRLTDKI